jgi:hypothetical protein
MEKLMTLTMGRAGFLRDAVLLAGGTLERGLPVRVLRNGPVPFGDQVRIRDGMAELLCPDRQGEYPHRERYGLVHEKDLGIIATGAVVTSG